MSYAETETDGTTETAHPLSILPQDIRGAGLAPPSRQVPEEEMMRTTRQAYHKAYREKHRAEKAAYMKQYRLDHLDEFKARDRARYEQVYATPEGRAAYNQRNKAYYEGNKEQYFAYARQQRAENPEKFSETRKKWYAKNADKLRAYNRKWTVEQRANDLNARLKHRLRTRLRHALLLTSTPKRCSVLKLIGCSLTELKAHIERQFTDGMSWDRIREIDIDHKRPCAAFDLTDPVQQHACFHFSNLQPLWASDNRRKHKKILS